jgi:hypothetical protein
MLRNLFFAPVILLVLPLASVQGQVRFGPGVTYYRPYPTSYYGLYNGRFIRNSSNPFAYSNPFYGGYAGMAAAPGPVYAQPTPTPVYVPPGTAAWYVQPSFAPGYAEFAPSPIYVQPSVSPPAASSATVNPFAESYP